MLIKVRDSNSVICLILQRNFLPDSFEDLVSDKQTSKYLLPFKKMNRDKELMVETQAERSTGPVYTYVKTDKNANFKWGVRHFVGSKYSRK